MAFEPKKITKEHVLKAIEHIKKHNIDLIPSTGYDVIINEESFPPKEILRYAHEQMNGEHLWKYSGGEPTNKFLIEMGFHIEKKDNRIDPVADMIRRYKERIRQTRMKDEVYKWILTKRYHHRPDISAPNFYDEITSIDYNNLIYPVAKTVINHIASERPEDYRNTYIRLLDDSIDLKLRVKEFFSETFSIYREIDPQNTYSHHHDERTTATVLVFYDANKYPLFKDSFYQKYCKMIGVKSKPKGEKYIHYIQLLNALIEDYILPDQELLELKSECIPEDGFGDQSHYIFAQDILYQTLDKKVEGERKYWRVGTTDGPKKYWDLMLAQKHISIGWSELGDLTERDIENKNSVIKLMEEVGFYMNDSRQRSRKAGEVYNFYSDISKGDVILAQDGQKINGIGVVTDEYVFQKDLDFPHTREVDWIVIDPENLINQKGLRTTVFEIDDPTLIYYIKELLSDNYHYAMNEEISLNTILYGPPGTGKTYNTVDFAVKIADPDRYIEGDHGANKKIYDRLIEQGQIVFITFHQSMCYEDFIEGIKPLKPENNEPLEYDVVDGIFKIICSNAQTPNQVDFNTAYNKLKTRLTEIDLLDLKTPTGREFSVSLNRNGNLTLHTGENRKKQGTFTKENIQKQIAGDNIFESWQGYFVGIIECLKSDYGYNSEEKRKEQNFVLIIDEINRGNVAEIFGELITLIEEDKRQRKDESLKVKLPYSKQEFSVPSNLYIIGTMNTADRSVEALDTALRRRFSFIERMPRYNLPGMDDKIFGIAKSKLLETINSRIEKLLDRDHQIGHSYFLGIEKEEDLQKVFKDKVLPLLKEYFFGDYEKLGLVLGKGFVVSGDNEKGVFAEFAVDDIEVYDKPIYHLKSEPFDSIDKFKDALIILMNNNIPKSEE